MIWHYNGRTWRRYAIPGMAVIWWSDNPDGNGGRMAFCPGEILLMESRND